MRCSSEATLQMHMTKKRLLVRRHRQDFENYFYLTVGKHSVSERWSALNQIGVNVSRIPSTQLLMGFCPRLICRTNKLFLQKTRRSGRLFSWCPIGFSLNNRGLWSFFMLQYIEKWNIYIYIYMVEGICKWACWIVTCLELKVKLFLSPLFYCQGKGKATTGPEAMRVQLSQCNILPYFWVNLFYTHAWRRREPVCVHVCACADHTPCLSVVQNQAQALHSGVTGAPLPLSNVPMLWLLHFQEALYFSTYYN